MMTMTTMISLPARYRGIEEEIDRSPAIEISNLEDARSNFGILGRGAPEEPPARKTKNGLYAMRLANPRICHTRGYDPLPSLA